MTYRPYSNTLHQIDVNIEESEPSFTAPCCLHPFMVMYLFA